MRGAFPIQIFPSQAKCQLYQIMEKYLLPLFLFLHSLRQRKIPSRMFQWIVIHNHIGYAVEPMFSCGVLQEVPMSHKFATLIRTT